jgi:hypothetical protein
MQTRDTGPRRIEMYAHNMDAKEKISSDDDIFYIFFIQALDSLNGRSAYRRVSSYDRQNNDIASSWNRTSSHNV